MTNLNPVTSVKQGDFEAPIGADAKDVALFDANQQYVGNLQDFYDNWTDFKENNNFSYTGDNTPSISQIKVWYQTYKNNQD